MADKPRSVEELFEDALSRAPEDRRLFLDQACADAPGLRRLVEELLRADEQAGSFLNEPPLSPGQRRSEETASSDAKHAPSEPALVGAPTLLSAGAVAAGRFMVHRFISRGGMGEVYEAWDGELKERVAIKTIRPELASSPEALDRFRREVKQARAISHPNVCRVHELFCHEPPGQQKVWFLSMEFLEGSTLSDYLRHEGPLQPAKAFEMVEQVVQGLSAAHRLGVVHRDFKTGNIMLVSTGTGRQRAVITDFGLATNVLLPDGETQDVGGQGTPAYMAPEQWASGNVTSRADQYALGIVMCEMLTGSRPKRSWGEPAPETSPVQLPESGLPGRWKRVILRCLQTRPEDRYRTVDEILPALRPRERRLQVWPWLVLGAAVAIALVFWHPFTSKVTPTSLAVLPLQNETGNPNLEYLSDGVSEALTDDLSRMPGLQVTAGSISRRYRGQNVDPSSAGRTLHVGSVVAGSLGADGSLRIPIELINARTGRQEWGQTYEGSVSNLAELQHEISSDVAYHLKITLNPDTKARLARQYSTNSITYNAYLLGRFSLGKRSPDALEDALADFQRALDHDPQYAPAFAGLADTYSLLGFYGVQDPLPSFNKAMSAAQHALELDSTLAEAYTSRAVARSFLNFDWQGAEEDYRRAIELNPQYPAAHTWFGLFLLAPLRRQAEADAQLEYTRALDPDSLVTTFSIATVEYLSGRIDKSAALCESRLSTLRNFEPALQVLADDYLAENRNQEVINLLGTKAAGEGTLRERAIPLGIAYAQSGQRPKALTELAAAESRIQQGTFLYYQTAELYTALGDRAKALDLLEAGYAKRESNLVFLNVDPLFAALRTEPRFIRLIKLMNLS